MLKQLIEKILKGGNVREIRLFKKLEYKIFTVTICYYLKCNQNLKKYTYQSQKA